MLNLFSAKKQNAVAVTELLLKALGVRVSKSTIKNALEDHPDYPSLLAVSDCLKEWGLENQAYQLDNNNLNKEDLLFQMI